MAQKKKVKSAVKVNTPEFKYKIRAGAPFKQEDAAVITAALMELTKEHGGAITALHVLEAARDEDHPLHQFFDWDDASAAEKYRINQARQIIKSVTYSVKTGKITVDVGAFVRIFNHDELPNAQQGRGYVPLPTAVEHVDFQEQVLHRAVQELKSFQSRYKNLSLSFTELRPVFEAIGKFTGIIEEKKKTVGGN